MKIDNTMMRCILSLINGLIFIRMSSGEFNIIRDNLEEFGFLKRQRLHCVTDSADDVIVWNTLKNGSDGYKLGPETSDIDGLRYVKERKCYINGNSEDCYVYFKNTHDWQFVSSSEVPMGPVLDRRWNKFTEYSSTDLNFEMYNELNDRLAQSLHPKYGNVSSLVASIRTGMEADIILCQRMDPYGLVCYWILIGGTNVTQTNLSRCENGLSSDDKTLGCSVVRTHIDDRPMNIYEWRTYLLTWNLSNHKIEFYDPDRKILSYIDDNSPEKQEQEFHLYFGSSIVHQMRFESSQALFRFHVYRYSLVTTSEVRIKSVRMNIDKNSEICIAMMIGLCITCELHANLMYKNGAMIVSKVFSDVERFGRIDHSLPVWQRVRIAASGLDRNEKWVVLELVTKSRDEHGNHWAFDEVEQCLPEGMVRSISIDINTSLETGDDIRPNMTCQKLSYNQQHSELINSFLEVSDPPANVSRCPMSHIGPKCSYQCQDTCQNKTLCDVNGCYCPPGYHSQLCNEPCSGPGAFGYGCLNKCENCREQKCDIITGRCRIGCKDARAKDKYLLLPYCNAVDFPPVPEVERTDERTLKFFFSKDEFIAKPEEAYLFEMSLQTVKGPVITMKQLAESETTSVNNKTIQIYFTVFHGLPIGSRCKARVVEAVQFELNDSPIAEESVFLNGEYSELTFLCKWDGKFSVKGGPRSLIISRGNGSTKMNSCPDDWYSVTIEPKVTYLDEVAAKDKISVPGEFPLTIGNLGPHTNYEVSINGKSPKVQYHLVVQTSVPNQQKVRDLTIVEVNWEKKNTLVRWKAPLSLLDDEIVQYDVVADGGHGTSLHYVLPFNRTCLAWKDSFCQTVWNPDQIGRTIKVRAVYKDGIGHSEWSEIEDQFRETGKYRKHLDFIWFSNSPYSELGETSLPVCGIYVRRSPDPPEIVNITETPNGYQFEWNQPSRTGGPMSLFIIQLEVISTRLIKMLQGDDRYRTIHFPVTRYSNSYKTQLSLLPSTRYKISVRCIVESWESHFTGDASSTVIDTSSAFTLKYKPRYTVYNDNCSISMSLPLIVHQTRGSRVYVIAIGSGTRSESLLVDKDLAETIELKINEVAWIVGAFSTPPPSILISDHIRNNGITDCVLYGSVWYTICIVVMENNAKDGKRARSLLWRSQLITIIRTFRFPHEAWIVPILVLLIVVICIIFYSVKRRNFRGLFMKKDKNLIYDVPDDVSQRPISIECHASFLVRLSYDDVNRTVDNVEEYEELVYNPLVNLSEFQDYVKSALSSGELYSQHSWLSPSEKDSWECEAVPRHGGNKRGFLIVHKSLSRKNSSRRIFFDFLSDNYSDSYMTDCNCCAFLFAKDGMTVLFTKNGQPNYEKLNARYVQGYKRNKAYIVMKGPEPTAAMNFWRMIWQERIQVICLLTDDMRNGQADYKEYWPKIGKSMKFGSISVSNINHTTFADHTVRTFHVECDQETRRIEHLHYSAWPEQEAPLYTQSIVIYLQKLLAIGSGIGPILVHCRADLGSAGTIILCDICLRRAAAEGVIDVFGETSNLKQQDVNMVGNKEQYIFVHITLIECLLSLPTAIPCDSFFPEKIAKFKNQLQLQQQRLEQSGWQDEALQTSLRLQCKLSEKNIAKNRFLDLLPRLRLYIPRYPTFDDDSSYISGVYVDSARRRDSYIASQLPMPTTVNDFWRMIAAFKINLIIILQQPDIQDPSCCKFLPESGEELEPVPFLSLIGKSVIDENQLSQQKVILIDKSEEPPVEQPITTLTCTSWDPGRNKSPPTPESLINLWQMSERIARSDEPTVVLCHDGVNGCGLFLALSFLLERMSLEHECDVCFAIRAVRRSRSNFCQPQEHFAYLYDAALLYAAQFSAYANFK